MTNYASMTFSKSRTGTIPPQIWKGGASPGLHLKTICLKTMMQVMGRAMQAVSQWDDEIRQELKELPDDFRFSIEILPQGPGLFLSKTPDGSFRYSSERPSSGRVDLIIGIKSFTAGFRMFMLLEPVITAINYDRTIVDGELGASCSVIRLLDVTEAYLLPEIIARRLIKRTPERTFTQRVTGTAAVYLKIMKGLLF